MPLHRIALAAALVALPVAALAQFSQTSAVPASAQDSPALKPPPGANVAIVEFADLECPACRAANPTLVSAQSKYKVPWQFHDLPIRGHVWSTQAAVNARWFSEKSKDLAESYRNAVYENQTNIATLDDLTQFTQKFAAAKSVQLPFVLDPQGKLLDAVHADAELGRSLGVSRTPTIFVVTAHSHDPGHPFVEVSDPSLLFTYLDQAVSATSSPKGAAQTASARKAHGTR